MSNPTLLYLQWIFVLWFLGLGAEAENIEKTKVKIPSIKLSQTLLADLCEVISKEYSKAVSENEDSSVDYVLEGKNHEIESHDSTSFLKYGIPKDLKEIRIILRSRQPKKQIWIRIDMDSDYLCSFDVEGTDPIWVNGISKQIEGVFERYRNRNDLFHSKWKTALPIYFGIAGVLAYVVYLASLGLAITDSEGKTISLSSVLIIPILMSVWVWHIVFGWLYPQVEIESMSRVKARKFVIGAIIALILSMLGNYIYQMISP